MSANPVQGEVDFAGRTLRLTARGFCLAEAAMGVNIPALAARDTIEGALSYRLCTAILFGSIAATDDAFTVADAESLLDDHGMNACGMAARMLLAAALPNKPAPGKAKGQTKKPGSTGPISSTTG